MKIPKSVLVDENNKPVAVQVNIKKFAKIERVLEDYALGQLIAEVAEDDSLGIEEAKAYYEVLPE